MMTKFQHKIRKTTRGVAGPMGRPYPSGSHFDGPQHRGDRDPPRYGNRPQKTISEHRARIELGP